jgi:hypothetical protein
MIYRALSMVEPAGQLIRSGRKTIEVRQWKPEAGLPLFDLLIIQNKKRLSRNGVGADPDGVAVALVDVVKIRKWEARDLEAACGETFEEGWLAWELQNVRPLDYPLPVPACLRIYKVDLDPGKCRFVPTARK